LASRVRNWQSGKAKLEARLAAIRLRLRKWGQPWKSCAKSTSTI
jgi:hypothetical protein